MAIEIRNVPLELIELSPYQTRKINDIEYIRQLAADIKANDLLEIPAAREIEDGHYQLAYGHNRLMAFRQLAIVDNKFGKMPLRIVEYTDEQMAITAWSENEQRKNLNPVERARAVNNLILKFGWNQSEVGEKLNLDRSTVSNLLRILRMPDEVQHNLEDGTLSQRQAMALAPYYDLTDLEKSVLVDNIEFQEFLVLARGGTFDSDTIRTKISGYLTVFQAAGEQRDQYSLPVEAPADIQTSPQEKTAWITENPAQSDPAPEVGRDAFAEYEEGRKTKDPASERTQPEKTPVDQYKPDEMLWFTISFNLTEGEFCISNYYTDGRNSPRSRITEDIDTIPDLLREMAPELIPLKKREELAVEVSIPDTLSETLNRGGF